MTLPDGFAVRLAPSVRVRDGGRTLVGGSPLRVICLTDRARGLFRDDTLRVTDTATAALAERLLASGVAEPVAAMMHEILLEQVTCVVPVRDRSETLDRLLSALQGLRVVVVDDASDSPRVVARVVSSHDAQLISLPVNRGPAGARNAGLRAVKTPYVLFVDSDVVVTPDAVASLITHFRDPSVAMVAPRVLGFEENGSWISRYEAARSSLDLGPVSGIVRPRTAISWVPSAVLAARVSAIGDGFDESMPVGEDVDLVWRLNDAGHRVRYDATIVARHDHRVRLISWLRRKAFYGSSADALAARHRRKVAPATFTGSSAITTVAILLQRKWSGPLVTLVAVATASRFARKLERADRPRVLAVELTAQGFSSTVLQLSNLLVRHWWPIAAVGALVSPRARRAFAASVVLESVVEYVRTSPEVNPFAFAIALRLDDTAYGAGVWLGAVRSRSLRALIPDFVRDSGTHSHRG